MSCVVVYIGKRNERKAPCTRECARVGLYQLFMSAREDKHMLQGRVLIVDDDAHVRKTVRIALQQGGYDVCEAEDGERAIDTLQHA